VLDVLLGWPDEHTAHIGLMLVHPSHRRQGIGRAALALLTEQLRSRPGITEMRVALVQANDAGESNEFWARCGFIDTGERLPYRYSRLESTTEIHRRPHPWHHPGRSVH
jgi:ribosomal protein S18 acetylase RimI-like enzyme